MDHVVELEMLPQPDDFTCGPTCLHAIYRYYEDTIGLDEVISQTLRLDEGGTLAVLLGCHALQRGYRARIYTFDLQIFDPTWFEHNGVDIRHRLKLQMQSRKNAKALRTIPAYIDFLEMGGELMFEDLTTGLIRRYLSRSVPILTGLSATYLYRSPREFGPRSEYDDVRGDPAGHFVVLCGYNRTTRSVLVADPFQSNPFLRGHLYEINIDRVICAILLGVLTYDANLLIIQPPRTPAHEGGPEKAKGKEDAGTHRRK